MIYNLFIILAADELMEDGFINILLHNLLRESKEIVIFHLKTLQHMMYGMQGKGLMLEGNGFSVMVKKILVVLFT